MKEKILVAKLWNELAEKANKEENRIDFITQYKVIVYWLKDHVRYFKNAKIDLQRWNLGTLIGLEPRKYVVDFLKGQKAYKLSFPEGPSKFDTFAMLIASHLWKMVTIISTKECPVEQGDLRYVWYQPIDTNEWILVLECSEWGYAEDLSGKKWKGRISKAIPATKDDLIANGIDVDKLIEELNSSQYY